jgi:hypothetical protein
MFESFKPILSDIFDLTICLFYIISIWKIFVKANMPGWKAFIPFYNFYLWVKISGNSGWILLLLIIPIINILIYIYINNELAKKFRKGFLFGFGVTILWFIFIPILAFDSSEYHNFNPTNEWGNKAS